ncbi:hypothetical protein ABZ671_00855 [Micromonospora sp. NPDC006766]|uniref:phage tail tube protein n=1 Tax=Micromonospora sp. NPDC006766 TaxID=3154778 RepID=UPI0033C64970
MGVNTQAIRAYQNGLVAVSDYGSGTVALPTNGTSALDAGIYKEVGAITSDGITEATSQDTNDIFMWQGNALAASLPGDYTKTFQFAAMETTLVTLGLQFPGSTITQTAEGVTIAEKPPVRDLRTWILHGVDGTKGQRIVIPLGQISERGDVVWSSQDVTVYQWTVKAFIDGSGCIAYRHYVSADLALGD